MSAAVDQINRRGACPALSSPMQTGDGLLVRLNPVSQGLTPKQLIGLCESATNHGNGIVEVTARGSIQLRGLTAGSVASLAVDVDALDIAVRTGVPVETGPLAGVDPTELADPRALADAIRKAIAEAGLTSRLGPKVSVVVDGGGRWPLDSISADVRCVAVSSEGGDIANWRISIAGDAQTATTTGVYDPAGACDLVLSLLAAIADLGIDGRARALPSPLWGGSIREQSKAERGGGTSSNLPSASCLSGTEPSPRSLRRLGIDPPHKGEGKAPSQIPLRAGTTALAIALPFGSMDSATLIAFANIAQNLGASEIRPAPPRALIVFGLSATACSTLQSHAAALGFITQPDDPLSNISACPGKPACASGIFATRAAARDTVTALNGLLSDSLTLHVSGCAKGCAHPAPASLTLVGDENGIGLVVNGTARQKPLAYTRPEALTASLQRLADAMHARGTARSARLDPVEVAAAFRQEV